MRIWCFVIIENKYKTKKWRGQKHVKQFIQNIKHTIDNKWIASPLKLNILGYQIANYIIFFYSQINTYKCMTKNIGYFKWSFNSCTKCVGSSGRLHDRTPNCQPVSWACIFSQLKVALIYTLRGSFMWLAYLLICYTRVLVQPGTGRRPGDWCRYWMSIL